VSFLLTYKPLFVYDFNVPTVLWRAERQSSTDPLMPKSHRIHNITRDVWPKYSQALNAVDCCACAWVVEGVSIRDLTLAESIAARNVQAKTREELPAAEGRRLIYEPCPNGVVATRLGWQLIKQANDLVC
jgi:hypothetical protein